MSYADVLGAVSIGTRCQSTSIMTSRISSSKQPTLNFRPRKVASICKLPLGRRYDLQSLFSHETRRGREIRISQVTAAADGESTPVGTKDRSALLIDLKTALEEVRESKHVGAHRR